MAIEAANENQKDEFKRAIFGAWHYALFERQQRLPSLERLMRGGEEMDDAELEAQLMAWAHSHNARYHARRRLGIAED